MFQGILPAIRMHLPLVLFQQLLTLIDIIVSVSSCNSHDVFHKHDINDISLVYVHLNAQDQIS